MRSSSKSKVQRPKSEVRGSTYRRWKAGKLERSSKCGMNIKSKSVRMYESTKVRAECRWRAEYPRESVGGGELRAETLNKSVRGYEEFGSPTSAV